jgi:hypothetical protein
MSLVIKIESVLLFWKASGIGHWALGLFLKSPVIIFNVDTLLEVRALGLGT